MTKENASYDFEINAMLHVLRNLEPNLVQELLSFDSQLERERLTKLRNIADHIVHIKSRLVSLKAEVRGDFSMELRDADYYRVNMFQLEGKIAELHQNIKSELYNLMKEESEICHELHSIERRLDEWSKPFNAKTAKPIVTYYKIAESNENDVTAEFQKFLATYGGHTGGWEEQDHILFLRERKRYHARPKFITVIHSMLPDISEDEVLAHENWFQKYEKLKQLQQDAIRKWRATKHTSLDKKNSSSDEQEDQKPRSYVRQRDITERIKEWKRQQLIKKAEEEERNRQEQVRQHEERLRKREIQKAKKSSVDTYKAEKLSRMQADLLSQQMKELQALEDRAKKSVLLKVFREQDQLFVEKKRMMRLESEMKLKQKEEKFRHLKPAVELTVERDPQRVLQATQVWNNHCAQHDLPQPTPSVVSLHTIQHLGVPSWRKSLNTDIAL